MKNQRELTHLGSIRTAGQERLARQTLLVPRASSCVAKRTSILNSLPKVSDYQGDPSPIHQDAQQTRQKTDKDYGNEEGRGHHAELIWLLQKPACLRDVLSLLPQPGVPAGSERRGRAAGGPV